MKKSRFTETQIVGILAEADAGMLVKDVCRKHGICGNTFYNWKKKYGGMGDYWDRRLVTERVPRSSSRDTNDQQRKIFGMQSY